MELQKIVKSQVDRARFGCKISTVIPGYIRPGKAVRLPKIDRKGMPWRSGQWLIETTQRNWLVDYDMHSNGKARAV